MALREQQKEKRRDLIVQAAEELIRETGDTDFSMITLAQRAGLSPATPYNLFGSKSAILYALLTVSADRFFNSPKRTLAAADPYQHFIRAADGLADVLSRDPAFYRPLYRFLFGVVDPVYRPAFMELAHSYWLEATIRLSRMGVLPPYVSHKDLARQFVVQAVGAIDMWVQFEVDEAQMGALLRQGACVLLLGMAHGDNHKALLAQLQTDAAILQSVPR